MKKVSKPSPKVLNNTLLQSVTSITRALSYTIRGGVYKGRSVKDGNYIFISSYIMHIKRFLYIMWNEHKNKKDIFVADLGCGISPLLIYLRSMDYKNLLGLDLEEKYMKYIKDIIHEMGGVYDKTKGYGKVNMKTRFLTKSLFNCGKDVKDVDMIYMYQPIADTHKFGKALKHIISHMKEGACLYESNNYMSLALKYADDLEFQKRENFTRTIENGKKKTTFEVKWVEIDGIRGDHSQTLHYIKILKQE